MASKNVEGFRKNYANVIHSQAFDHLKQLVITFLYTKEIGMIKIRRSGRRNFLILHMEHFVEKKIKNTSFFRVVLVHNQTMSRAAKDSQAFFSSEKRARPKNQNYFLTRTL